MTETPTNTSTSELLRRFDLVLESEDRADLDRFLDEITHPELSLILSRLPEDVRNQVLSSMPAEEAADILERLADVQSVEFVQTLEPEVAANIISELRSDAQADVIGELEEDDAEAILDRMPAGEAANARELIQYDDDVAGGLMATELLRYRDDLTVGSVIEDMRDRADEYRDYDVQYAYVSDSEDRLVGVLRLRDLLLARRARLIKDLMIQKPISVKATLPLEELVDLFDEYHFLGVPVVNNQGQIVGVVQRSKAIEAWEERQTHDFLKTQGIVGGDELRSMPIHIRSRRRLAWLSTNIILNVCAASVIASYQETLSAVIALAVFLPIISDMSGCSGSQAVAVSLRELTLGLLRTDEFLRVWIMEALVGIINGVILGALIGVVAYLWKGNIYLGLVVGGALGLNTLLAVSIGGLIPLVLRRWRLDPAIASGPILTTITDMCGFFLVLAFATALLPYLT